jgi:dolichyl-phosphate-mannose-protein mannosyltransferase
MAARKQPRGAFSLFNSFASPLDESNSPRLISAALAKEPRVATAVFLGVGFLALAVALRVVFLNWGLPYIHHSDEPNNLAIIHRMIGQSDLNPGWFHYPSFLFYINLPGQYFVKWWDGALLPFTMQSMGNGLTEQPEAFRVARLTTLLFGSAVLPLLIIWARTVSVGVAGHFVLGVLFCLNPLLLRHSTLISPDIFAAFFTTGTLFASSLIVLRGSRLTYVLAGVLAGLAASSKYNAGLVAVAIPAAHVMRNGLTAPKLLPLALAAATTGSVFLAASPFIVVHPRLATHDILYEVFHYSKLGHPGAEGNSFARNTEWMLDNFGFAGLLAFATCFSSRFRVLLPTIVFTIVYFLLLIVQRVSFERNLLPLVPAVVLLVAAGIDAIAQVVARALPNARSVISAISAILALALFAGPAMSSFAEVTHYTADSRAKARAWLNGLLPRTPARAIAVEPYAPYIAEQGHAVTEIPLALDMDPAALARFSYVVLSRAGSGRFFQGPYDVERANLAALKARSCDHHEFPAHSAEPDFFVFVFGSN